MKQLIKQIYDKPHILGHWLGYDLLTDIHSKWIKDSWETKKDHSLQAHRNSYKTTDVLVVGTIWWLLFNPDDRILIIRKEFEGAVSVVSEIRKHYESEKLISLYQEIYNDSTIDKLISKAKRDSISLITKTKITKEGNIECLGVGGSITGRHYEKVKTDDIITIKDRISKAERENTKIFIGELKNIPVPGGTITHTGTPWHPEDGWTLLPEPDKYPIGSIEIKGFTKEFIEELKKGMTSSMWAANYELIHIADIDRLFPEPSFGRWDERIRPVVWIDPAYSGKATTAMAMIGEHEGVWYCRGWAWRKHIVDLYSKIVNICNDYKAGTMYIETNGDKGFSKRDLSQLYPSVIGRDERANKHNKIISFGVQHFHKLLIAYDCQPGWLAQVLDYQEGEDLIDAPDTLASLMRELGFSGDLNVSPSSVSASDIGL